MSVFLFHGSDDVLVSEAVSDKVRELVGEQDRSLMLEEFDGDYVMAAVTEAGAVVYPPVPAFYAKPQSLEQMVDHSVARVLDLFNLDSGAAHRWDPGAATDTVTNSDTEANHGPSL
jgi:hypothetical protein